MANTQYTLHLKGFVGGPDFDRNYVDFVLSKHNNKPVNVLIDSLGGSVATALSIASAFRNHGDVTVHFVGMNASAATIASLGAKHISIDANAMYLVHKCSSAFFEWGSLNADQFASLIADIEKIKADLDKLDLNIARMYSARCKKNASKSVGDLLALMSQGGWLTSQEALDWGFVDEITDLPEEAAPKLTDAVASEMAAAGIPIPNVPVADSQGVFARFLASLASLFKSSNPSSDMSKESAPQTDARVAELEANLVDRDKAIAELREQLAALNAEISALKEKPGDSTTNVVDTNHTKQDETPLDAYYRRVNAAKEMFNALP